MKGVNSKQLPIVFFFIKLEMKGHTTVKKVVYSRSGNLRPMTRLQKPVKGDF